MDNAWGLAALHGPCRSYMSTGLWRRRRAGPVTSPPPPPPPAISVTMAPKSGSVLLGSSQSFSATVTNTLLGGSVGHLHSHVEEVPVFYPGEEVYLFLWGRGGEPYQVLGWSQGSFRIARNPQSGLEVVTQDSASAAIFDPQTRAFRRGGIRNLPLAIFKEKLHEALKQENQ